MTTFTSFLKASSKPIILIVDEISYLLPETALSFFQGLEHLKETQGHNLHSFSSIGLLSATIQPTSVG
jgi:hypothetical protein